MAGQLRLPDEPGPPSKAKRSASEVYECRNQWWNLLKSRTGSNLAGIGGIALHARVMSARATPKPMERVGGGRQEQGLRWLTRERTPVTLRRRSYHDSIWGTSEIIHYSSYYHAPPVVLLPTKFATSPHSY